MADDHSIKSWFANLKKLQDQMEQLNHLTEDSLEKFSKQRLGDLLVSDLMIENLRLFCALSNIGIIDNNLIRQNGKENFKWLLDKITFPIKTSLLLLAYSMAVKHDPALLDKSVGDVQKMDYDVVFGPDVFSTNPIKQELDKKMTDGIPGEFYSKGGIASLDEQGNKVKDIVPVTLQ
jgi:hypothetical protein